jgi:hypothetical protein
MTGSSGIPSFPDYVGDEGSQNCIFPGRQKPHSFFPDFCFAAAERCIYLGAVIGQNHGIPISGVAFGGKGVLYIPDRTSGRFREQLANDLYRN